MKTNDSTNRSKMAKIDTFEFKAVDNERLVEDIRREEEARLNKKGTPPGEREYRFYTTNSVKRVDTQSVHKVMNTTAGTGRVYNTNGTTAVRPNGAHTGAKRNSKAIMIPLSIVFAYILSVVAIDIMGLLGYRFGMTPVSVVLYVLYIALSLLGVMLLMFMDMLPKPLALLVLFVSIFCVNGNMFLVVPLVVGFVGIVITVEGAYTRMVVSAMAVFMAFYAVVIGFSATKVSRSEVVVSDDGKYQLVSEMRENGDELAYLLILETRGTVYKRYVVCEGYVATYRFESDGVIAYGIANEFGEMSAEDSNRVSVADIVG